MSTLSTVVRRSWTARPARVSYHRAPDLGAEVMRAHFVTHAYHRHSHDTYSFGITESGAQAFRCRGGQHVSTAGLVMAFNPEDPHDGHAGDPAGQPPAAVAAVVGFADQAHLTRWFRRTYGITPAAYQRASGSAR